MTTSSTPDRGRALLMSTAAASFVLSAALVAGPAAHAQTCTPNGTTTTCSGDFPAGTSQSATGSDLTVVTDNTVTSEGTIAATSTGGNATINNAGTVSTTADATPGLSALSTGGNVTVTSTGSISTSGAGSNGVYANATGNTTVTVGNVTVAGVNSAGVVAVSTGGGAVDVTVNQGTTVSGTNTTAVTNTTPNGAANAGVVMSGATMTLDNNGTISVEPATGSFSVVTVGDGAAVINNNSGATLNGPILLNANATGAPSVGNVVNNAGTWNVAGGSSSFFGTPTNNNVLNNTGTITTVPSAQGAQASEADFVGLSTFNNAGGVVDLTSGNSLNIENAQFNGGQGSTLRVNANSQSGVLTVGSTGQGTTRVVLADIPATHPAMDLSGETLVTGPQNSNGGPAQGSFNFGPSGNDLNAGFVDYRLVFNQASQNTPSNFELFGLPGQAVFEALNIPFALQNFWRNSAFPLTQRQMSIRDSLVGEHPSRADGWEFWAIPYGGSDFFKRPQVFQFGGFFFPGVGNHNDTVGLQVGADMLGHFGSGSGIGFLGVGGAGTGYWGFTGGVEQQTTHFPGDDANNLYSVGGNFGVYGGANWGGFYANALGKVDFDDMNTNFQTANFSPSNIFKAYGARGEVGYRWPWSGFYVEPSARVNAIWTDGIDLNPAGALLHFNSGNASVDGEVGGRVGTTFNFGKFFPGPVSQFNPFPGQFNIYFGAWWADQWDGHNLMSFTTFGGFEGRTTIGLAQPSTGSFIHTEYGLETADWYGGLKMFLKGENNFDGDSVGGWSAEMGVRFSF